MKDRIDIHVGQHKTGTSAIQKSLNQNREWLLTKGILYPQPDCLDAHHQIASYVLSTVEDEAVAHNKFCEIVDAWSEQANFQNCLLLLSSEIFSEGVDLDYLKGYFSDKKVRIIIYIRRQDLLLESVYNQVLKQNGMVINNIVETPPYNLDTWNITRQWEYVVGEGNVIVKKYEINALKYKNIACDFLDIYKITEFNGFDFNLDYINKSLGLNEFKLLEEMVLSLDGKHLDLLEGIRKRLKNVILDQDISMVGNFLDTGQRIEIMKRVEEGNNQIRDKYFSDQESLFEPITDDTKSVCSLYSWAEIVAKEYLNRYQKK